MYNVGPAHSIAPIIYTFIAYLIYKLSNNFYETENYFLEKLGT